ncbi:MAG TPA: hypothetical protein VGJ55_05810 [Pyrinomonadaceae bacterium]|jgi:hypothetical protein
MNCICDDFRFPPETLIVSGLTELPRQTGTFAEFRRALLRAISIRSTAGLENNALWSLRFLLERDRDGLKKELEAIGRWRGRHPEDFGMMLLEMWAYVCDLTSFYDEVLANESYVRTAHRRDSLRRLVDPLGYIPRPAVAALADLAAYADGRQVVTLPLGTAFRSGAFPGSPPQVFELLNETAIHPLLNEWMLLPLRPATFGSSSSNRTKFLCELGSVAVKADDIVLVEIGAERYARTVAGVSDIEGADHLGYSQVEISSSVPVPANTNVSAVKLWKPSATANLWSQTPGGYGPQFNSSFAPMLSGNLGIASANGALTTATFLLSPSAVVGFPTATWFLLESINRAIHTGQDVIIKRSGVLNPRKVIDARISSVVIQAADTAEVKDAADKVIAKVPIPAIEARTTKVVVEPSLPGLTLYALALDDSTEVVIYHSMVSAGTVTVEAFTEISDADSLNVGTPVDLPRDTSPPGEFQLEDFNGVGLTRPGSLNFSTGEFSVHGDHWPDSLATPVKLLGNIIGTSRGETVNNEALGSGDASIANQNFKLKKSPLTYLPFPSGTTPSGLVSTLKVFVDGLQWTEVTSFFGHSGDEEVYIVRQNDKGESVITFGDGVFGRRLNTGASVVAYYRQGAGGKMPPAGSITQLAKPVTGLKSVRSPVAPYGGADEEPSSSLAKFAPRSALLLGRAVSLADLEAAAASYAGVRAVAAEWRWSTQLQIPAAHVWYLADGDLTELILSKLRSLTQPDTPIQVERAVATPAVLSIQLARDPKRFEDDVLAAARTALMDVETGLLPPERLGIGKPLFRSQLFEFLLAITGVVSITGLTFESAQFSDFGIKPAAGHYFDFSSGLLLNGRSE